MNNYRRGITLFAGKLRNPGRRFTPDSRILRRPRREISLLHFIYPRIASYNRKGRLVYILDTDLIKRCVFHEL